jgi:hypothetical protein
MKTKPKPKPREGASPLTQIPEQVNFRANDRQHPNLAHEFHHAIHDHRSDRSGVLRELLDAYVRKVNELGRPPEFPLIIQTAHHGRRKR